MMRVKMFLRQIPAPGLVVYQTRSLSGGGGGGGGGGEGVRKMKVDVVVAGGGMVGSAAAGALAQLGREAGRGRGERTDWSVQVV